MISVLRPTSSTADSCAGCEASSRASLAPTVIGASDWGGRISPVGARLAREGTPTDATTLSPNKNGSLDGLPFCLRLTDDSRQTREHFLGFALLPRIALGHHLIEDVPSAVIVAHVDVGLGQVEFGGDFVSAREEIELII